MVLSNLCGFGGEAAMYLKSIRVSSNNKIFEKIKKSAKEVWQRGKEGTWTLLVGLFGIEILNVCNSVINSFVNHSEQNKISMPVWC